MKNLRPFATGLLALALVATLVLAWRDRAALADLRAQLRATQTHDQAQATASDAQARQHAQELEQRVHDLEQVAQAEHHRAGEALDHAHELEAKIHDLESRLADAQRTVAKLKAARPAAPAAAATDPAALAVEAGRVRRQMQARYGALTRQLGLTPPQTDQFMKLLVDKQLAANDLLAAGVHQGASVLSDPAGFADLVAAQQDDLENQIQALLGDAGYAQYLQWGVAAGQASSVARLQSALAASEPLTDAQVAQLQQLLAASRVGHFTAKTVATVQAQGILSPTQFQTLANLLQQQQAAQQSRSAGPTAAPAPGK